MLELELTGTVLATSNAIGAIRQWLCGGSVNLDGYLQDRLASVAARDARGHHFHQAHLAFKQLACDWVQDHPTDSDSKSWGELGSSSIGTNAAPWFLRCMTRLADRILCEDRGRVALRWSSLELAQHAFRLFEPTQLIAAFYARRIASRARSMTPSQRETEIRFWSRDAILPRIACTFMSALAGRGLVETHRHMNISMQPVLMWGRLMQLDRLPDGIGEHIAQYIRATRRLRPMLSRRLCCDQELRFEKMSESPSSRLQAPNAQRGLPSGNRNLEYLLSGNWFCETAPAPAHHACWSVTGAQSDFSSAPYERELQLRLFERLWLSPTDELSAAVHAYCVLQNLVYRDLVMAVQAGDGLDRFTELFAANALRDLTDRECPERLVLAYRAGCVHWLEARMTPGDDIRRRVYGLRDSFAQRIALVDGRAAYESPGPNIERLLYQQRPQPKYSLPGVGLVLHFVKRPRNERQRAKCVSMSCCTKTVANKLKGVDDNPSPKDGFVSQAKPLWGMCARDQQARVEAWNQVDQIAEAMAADPLVARMIIGFDVCGSEAATEMGTFAAHLRYLREFGRPIFARPVEKETAPDQFYESGRTYLTCHAGEDFAHLLSGLRHVDEALRFYDLREGDRIGHGTALGVEPSAWGARQCGVCFLACGEWLDDLVWFHQWLMQCDNQSTIRFQVSREIEMLSRRVYGRSLDPASLWEAWILRREDPGDPFPSERESMSVPYHFTGGRRFARSSLAVAASRVEAIGLAGNASACESNTIGEAPFQLWRRYHADRDVAAKWQEPVRVELDPRWDDAIARVQQALTAKLVRLRVAIEINPSSNLTIGPFERLVEHPVFRWVDPRCDFRRGSNPLVIVGTDDPSTFGTELLHEYGFLARAAEDLGATERQVHEWLTHLRQTSIDFSFLPHEAFSVA